MTFKALPRVRETTLTEGEGDIILEGAPVGFQPFAAVGTNNTCPVHISDGVDWEDLICTVKESPSRLERTAVLGSSNSGNLVDWGAGEKTVILAAPASQAAPSYFTTSVAGGDDVTLGVDEALHEVIRLTGTITANINVIVPATPFVWVFMNGTAGAFTITVKTASGTGVALRSTGNTIVFCDGTNCDTAGGSGEGGGSGSATPNIDWLCFAICPDGSELVISEAPKTIHPPDGVIVAAYMACDTPSDDGAIVVDFKRVSDTQSIFTTPPQIDQGEDISDDSGTPLALAPGQLTFSGRVKYATEIVSAGANATGVKLFLGVVWGSEFVYDPDTGELLDAEGIGRIEMFAGPVPDYCIQLTSSGQTVSRATYALLFARIGTTWGAGNGSTTFGLPPAPGRAPVASGSGSGLTARTLGQTFGAETVTLTAAQSGLPSHTHGAGGTGELQIYGAGGETFTKVRGADESGGLLGTVPVGSGSTAAAGGSSAAEAHTNVQPSIVYNFGIRFR